MFDKDFSQISYSYANRLTHIKENHKFQKDGKEGHRVEDPSMGLRHVVMDIKEHHNIKYVRTYNRFCCCMNDI